MTTSIPCRELGFTELSSHRTGFPPALDMTKSVFSDRDIAKIVCFFDKVRVVASPTKPDAPVIKIFISLLSLNINNLLFSKVYLLY